MARKAFQFKLLGRANAVATMAICGLLAGLLLSGCSKRQELDWADYYKVAKNEKDSNTVPPGSFGSGQGFGSGAVPFGSGMPFGSGAMPFGSGVPYGSGAMPFGSAASNVAPTR